ncbi:Alanine racemase [hydrothermal vent metagenome]|uniref:Alanine racemase n=1 Tax=hydrothermal vent metagenome TaxID=652676 RepID=A0A1W1C480_9ZZZZ
MPFIMINKQNFFNNLDIIAQKTKSKDKIAIVLKDNAYGHGLDIIANLAKEYGLTQAVVQNEKEAKSIASLFDTILVLADIPQEPSDKIHYTINSLQAIPCFPKGTKVELKVDTGMHRNGIAMEELEMAFEALTKEGLELVGVFSHHRSADELTGEWFWQNENFKRVKKESLHLCKHFGIEPPRFHIDNSASLMRRESFCEDIARVGIAVYGCLELPKAFECERFEPVLSLYAKKISTKKLKKGARVGYGGACEVAKDTIISTYDIGYGDGFLRSLSHHYITPHNYKIAGRISMDNSSFYSNEEELLVFDDAREVAKKAGTISYEILTALKADIPRRII